MNATPTKLSLSSKLQIMIYINPCQNLNVRSFHMCHFHTLDPNDVSRHAFSVAAYLFEADVPVNDGETIAGLLNGEMAPEVHWPCRFEMSLIQPAREVMDVCPGEYAAGERE